MVYEQDAQAAALYASSSFSAFVTFPSWQLSCYMVSNYIYK